jgi:predicted metal-dependent phosphoesterase TrpH
MRQQKQIFRVDLHMHSWFSADSITSPPRLVRRAREAGLDRVAVTDHGSIDGALEAAALDPGLVIVGEEIKCKGGAHIIGLFLQEHVPTGRSVEETVDRIRAQGAVVYAPHPYAYVTRSRRRAEAVLGVADVVEVFNSRAFVGSWNRLATAAAAERSLPCAAGSDAHMPWEIGRACTEIPCFTDAASFLCAVREARPAKQEKTTAFIHCASVFSEATRVLVGRGHGTRPPFR